MIKNLAILWIVVSSSISSFAQYNNKKYNPNHKNGSLLPDYYSKFSSYVGYSATLDNPVGIIFGFNDLFYNTGVYATVNFGTSIKSLSYDYTEEQEYKFHHEITDGTNLSYKLDKESYSLVSYQFNIGVHTNLPYGFGIFHGVGYGAYERVYDLNVYETDLSKPIKVYKIYDSDNNINSISTEYGVSYIYQRVFLMFSATNIGFERYSMKLSIAYIF